MKHALPTGFEPEFQWTHRTTRSDVSHSVLYVDDTARIQTVAEYVEREGVTAAVVGTSDHEAAVDVLDGDWDCLVVGDVPQSVHDRLSAAADCTVVRFTDESATGDQDVAVVDRRGDDSVGVLFETVASHIGANTPSSRPGFTDVVDATSDGSTALFLVDEAGRVTWSSEPFDAVFPAGATAASETGEEEFYDRIATLVADAPEPFPPEGDDGRSGATLLRIPAPDGDRFYRHQRHRIPAAANRRLELFEDVTASRRRGPDHGDSASLDRADALLRDVLRNLGEATSREDLSEAVCRRIVDHDGFALAWIGQREGANERLVPTSVAGAPESYLREVVAATSREDAVAGPVVRAVAEREVQVVQDIREENVTGLSCDTAVTHGIHSFAAVPLTHGETVHGVLAVYGDEAGAFDAATVESFALMGETIGFALTAVRNRRLLQRDVTLELEFRCQSDEGSLVALAADTSSQLETAGAVDLGDESLQYVRVEGASATAVAERAREIDPVAGVRVVRDADEDGGVVEIRTTNSLQHVLCDAGAWLREAVASPSGICIVVEAPADADVRAIHEAICERYPDTQLACKTELDDPLCDDEDVHGPREALTDRQSEVLRAAYLAGYYAWPRDTTAEELADSLDIASPTLHQHLRRAEYNLLEALFDEA